MKVNPFLKWAGGKRQLLSQLQALLPADAREGAYHEPFLGGGALFFAFEPKEAYLYDLNKDLMLTYEVVRNYCEDVITHLEIYQEGHRDDEGFYNSIRSRFNARTDADSSIARAAQFIYLNRSCFNGLWRVNKKGEFNVSKGSYKVTRDLVRAKVIREASRVLQRAQLYHTDYQLVRHWAREGDFIYFDPPYIPIQEGSFTSFTSEGFSDENHQELANLVRDLVNLGCRVLVSNSDTPLTRELYKGLLQVEIKARRSINRKASGRGPVGELAIVGGYTPAVSVTVQAA